MSGTAIDLGHLARYTGGESGLNTEILGLFSTQTATMIEHLGAALASADVSRWREITHSLKGAANGVGAFALGDAAAIAETIDPSAEPARAAEALGDLKRSAAIVGSFIDTYLGR